MAKARTAARKGAPNLPPAEELLGHYRDMLLIRRFEEKAGQLYGMGLIGGFCHLYIGQEADRGRTRGHGQGGRPAHHHLSRPRPHAGLRHGPWRRDGRVDRAGGRLFQGQGRLDAHVLEREGVLRRPRDRRRQRAARRGARLREPLPGQRQHLLHLFRRRRGQPGAGLRDLQHGGAVEAAGRLRHRKQPVRNGHVSAALDLDAGALHPRRGLRHPGRGGRRNGRAGRAQAPARRRPTTPAVATAHTSSR